MNPVADHEAWLRGEGAFEALTEPYRRELQVHCYRMLGSLTEAEDLVQETLLRAWRNRQSYAGRAPVRAWLYKIATNACLDELAHRARGTRRGLPSDFFKPADPLGPVEGPVLDPIWLEPFPDALLPEAGADPAATYDRRESVRLAFLVALQALPPKQRAILLLRDVLGWSAAEVAGLLDLSPASVTSALYRARTTLSGHTGGKARIRRGVEPDDASDRDLLARYVAAWENADVEALTLLLKEDATFPMPPLPAWYRGRASIRAFLEATVLAGDARGRWRLVPTRANGCPAFGLYRRRDDGPGYVAFAVQVVTLDAGLVEDATTFGFPHLFRLFGLPDRLAG
ncbi:MAG TPA: sigma-70 family RNA polymerase sigma factor [Anaerolineales bacterium]|nr:sigma-70 family RNA polymerase sigma factor [Anaerolineales bacterium]